MPLVLLDFGWVDDPLPPPSAWSIDLCQSWRRIGQLQGAAFEFHGVERFNEIGEWGLKFPEAAPSWSHYTDPVSGFPVPYTPLHVDSIRLVVDGVVRFSGVVGEATSGTGGAERTLDAAGTRWSLSGPDMWDILRSRVAFPVPATATPSDWASAYDVKSGVASSVLAAYINDNAGPAALAGRAISNLAVVDTVTGMSGDWSGRLQSLYELARRICADAEITIRWGVTADATTITATIQDPGDLSGAVLLSDQADLISVRSRLIPAKATWVVAGGTGTGTGRLFRTAASTAAGLDRRELFVDVSSLGQAAEVQATASTNRRLGAETWSVSAEVSDAASTAFGFGRSVLVGDKVTIQVAANRFVVPVTALAWEVTAERQAVRPTLGEAAPNALTGLLRDVANLAGRFDNQIA